MTVCAFLWTLLAAFTALLLVHTIWRQWDGGFAFSQRFLTSLFPLFLIGIAELQRRFGWRIVSSARRLRQLGGERWRSSTTSATTGSASSTGSVGSPR